MGLSPTAFRSNVYLLNPVPVVTLALRTILCRAVSSQKRSSEHTGLTLEIAMWRAGERRSGRQVERKLLMDVSTTDPGYDLLRAYDSTSRSY